MSESADLGVFRLSRFGRKIPMDRLRGLRPKAWVSVGPGFVREDVKAALLAHCGGFSGDAVTTLQDLCQKILNAARVVDSLADGSGVAPIEILGGPARQEVLRALLAESRISSRMPELKRLRRQGNFFKRLDQAIQMGRLAFLHAEEEEVYSERLRLRFGPNPLRDEIRALSAAYEAWLGALSLMDPPLLIREAARSLRERGWPEVLPRPEEIWNFSAQTAESLEKEFWDALAAQVRVEHVGPLGEEDGAESGAAAGAAEGAVAEGAVAEWSCQRWHTVDDAAESLAERLAGELRARGTLEDQVILIPDIPSVRRTLKRALDAWGVPEADPRDPTRLRWDEAVKWAMLPLEVVARNFERPKVIAWLRAYLMQAELPRWVAEINARGIRSGLGAYAGGGLAQAHSHLSELADLLGGRKTCEEFAEGHLKLLRTYIGDRPEKAGDFPVVSFFEQVWKEFCGDCSRIGGGERRAPLLYFLERFQARVAESPAPVEKTKTLNGIRVYRLQQAPVFSADTVWALAVPPQWLSGDEVGDYWFSSREREVLSGEFAVRSAIQLRQERIGALRAWMEDCDRVHVLDAQYDADGRERESVFAVLAELAALLGREAPAQPVERGAHRRWLSSHGALRPCQPQRIVLPPIPTQKEMTATALDRYSRCGVQALAAQRWKLWDGRDPDSELWPEVKGNILHYAVKVLLQSRTPDGAFSRSPSEALDEAWVAKRPKGLMRSPRVERYAKSRLLPILEAFCEKEREYAKRSGTHPVSLDDLDLRLEFPEFTLVGTPDRIDEHPDGLFIMDYKSTSGNPNGTEMLELGYRLQLPFYALAASRQLGKPVIGLQFIELNRKAGRGSGIFFKKHNGKEPGKLTNARSNSKSLMTIEPEEAWSRFEESVVAHAKAFLGGVFEARPKKKEKECRGCMASDLCGFRRMAAEGAPSEEGE